MITRKFRHRKMTTFLCKELLYEYQRNLLDSERKEAVEDFLKSDEECQRALKKIQSALRYAEKLRETSIRPDILQHLKEVESAVSIGRKYTSWKQWPETVRWSIVALTISISVAAVVAIVPWQRLPKLPISKKSNVLELADLSRASGISDSDEAMFIEDESVFVENDHGSGDEEMDAEGLADEVRIPVAALGSTPSVAEKPKGVSASAPPETTAGSTRDANTGANVDTNTDATDARLKGFVYRAFMNLANLEDVGDKITAHIVDLGGTKAGEVELGWKRGEGRYYHFALPSESEEQLLESLRAYGPVRISKDPHGRVMPQGQVRFILWVEPL